MSTSHAPQYEIPSTELANWLDSQGADLWWRVENDPLLTGRISFPCPGDELSAELRKIHRAILVFAPPDKSVPALKRQQITAADLDVLAGHLRDTIEVRENAIPKWGDDRILFLKWLDFGDEWLLVEDSETSASSRADSTES